MAWLQFPDSVLERIVLASISTPLDVISRQSIERRIRGVASSKNWQKAAAFAHLGADVCAALQCSSASEVDWPLALRSASAGLLRCSTMPRCGGSRAERSGHACTIFRSRFLIIFGGAQYRTDSQPHPSAVGDTVALDILHGRWLEVQAGLFGPCPRLRPTLTRTDVNLATLIGGQTFEGPGTGAPFRDVWSLKCGEEDGEAIKVDWKHIATNDDAFSARSCHTTVNAPCGLLVFGGVGQEGHVLPCEAVCLDGDVWHNPPQSGVFPPQGALHHGHYGHEEVILIGGLDDSALQARGLGKPTEVHTLNLRTWTWHRLQRHTLSPPLHARSAMFPTGNRIFLVGGDPGTSERQSNFVAVLHLDTGCSERTSQVRQAVWSVGSVSGLPFAAAGHTVVGGILLGGLNRTDAQSPVAFLLPDVQVAGTAKCAPKRAGVPRWFKR